MALYNMHGWVYETESYRKNYKDLVIFTDNTIRKSFKGDQSKLVMFQLLYVIKNISGFVFSPQDTVHTFLSSSSIRTNQKLQ
jgi:hypothetical protein